MRVIENSIVIQRPVADVFAYIHDYPNDVHWRGGVRMMMQSTPEVQVGTETHEVLHFLGRDYLTDARISEYVPNSKSAFVSMKGTFPVTGWRQVTATPDGTRLTMHTEIGIGGIMRPFAPLLANAFSRQMRADLIALKRLLES